MARASLPLVVGENALGLCSGKAEFCRSSSIDYLGLDIVSGGCE